MRSKPVLEEFGQPRTTPEACKVALAMAKRFTFALRLSRLQRLRSSRKPSPLRTSRLSLPPADGMIHVFFHEPCRLSKQWPRSFFAITRCGKTRSVAASQNRFTRSPQRDDGERDCETDLKCSVSCSYQARARSARISL